MATPINPDKSFNNRADKPTQTQERKPLGRDHQPDDSSDPQPTQAADSKVDVETARQLYQMESQRTVTASHQITNPEQASALLDQILAQISNTPEQALRAQAPKGPAVLASLLERAPV
jgi:hypothetical protein